MLIGELFSTGSLRAGSRLLGLKEDSVDCELAAWAKDGPFSYASAIEELRSFIASGAIRVPYDEASESDHQVAGLTGRESLSAWRRPPISI